MIIINNKCNVHVMWKQKLVESKALCKVHHMHRKYHMEITHVEHTRRSKTQNRQKRPKMAIFGGFKALAESGVEVLQNKNFSCKVQSI